MTPSEKIIYDVLSKSTKMGAKKREELAVEIDDALIEEGWLVPEQGVSSIEVDGARVPVETVQIYGLTIEVDANGNAVTVSSERGEMRP